MFDFVKTILQDVVFDTIELYCLSHLVTGFHYSVHLVYTNGGTLKDINTYV